MAMDETVEAGSIADLSVAELLHGLLESGSRRVVDVGPGSIHVVQARCGDDKFVVAAFDYSHERGSIGLMEAKQLVAAIRLARQGGILVFLMNTSGIRVTDSTAGIASLRKVLREAEDARLQGTRMLAMIVRHAFGGASILAALCEKRVIHDGCLYAMSGPKLIERVAGADQFDAGDRRAVRNLLGGAARASQSDNFVCVDGTLSGYRKALIDWLRRPAPAPISLSELRASGAALEARLGRKIPEAEAIARADGLLADGENEVLDAIHPSGSSLLQVSNVIVAKARCSASSARVLALIAREGCGFGDALALSRELLGPGSRDERYTRSVLIVDSESHAATPADEGLVLSEALAHLALVVRWLHHTGRRVDVVVTGLGGGGIQGALGSAASSVAMGSAGRLRVLPEVAMRALEKAEDVDAGSISMAIAVGAVDFEFHPVRRQGATDVV
jgi:hypothetical protein